MPRSLKKGPFVDDHLLAKVDVQNEKGGEFAPTRTFKGHIKDDRKSKRR